MTKVTLDNGTLRTTITPEEGAGMLSFDAQINGAWLPIMPDAQQPDVDLDSVNFIMIPYSNRIEDGRFTFQGEEYELRDGDRHSIHGDTRGRRWTVAEQTETRLVCTFDSRHHPDVNWPWPFTATARYELTHNALTMELELWNWGQTKMPAGFGWHPYFSRHLTNSGEPVHLKFGIESVYPDANGNRIPSGPAQPPTPAQDYRSETALAPDTFLDVCTYGYDGNGYIHWPESGVRLLFDCSDVCSHLVMYNPSKPYFAIEPVTNANNGVNLYAQGDETSGVVVLAPGESLQATFTLRVETA